MNNKQILIILLTIPICYFLAKQMEEPVESSFITFEQRFELVKYVGITCLFCTFLAWLVRDREKN